MKNIPIMINLRGLSNPQKLILQQNLQYKINQLRHEYMKCNDHKRKFDIHSQIELGLRHINSIYGSYIER